MKKKQKIGEEDLGKNPLAGIDFKIMVNRVTSDEALVYMDEDLVPQEGLWEREEFVKFYTKSENRLLISKLSGGAKSLMLFVAYSLDSGKDWLEIKHKRFMHENGIKSLNTYKAALSELIKENILAYTTIKGYYWTNPRYFFIGSRLKKYKENVVEYKPPVKTRLE